MRASDEKSAIYWLANMLHCGEGFRFIARRIVIFASEDVGLADSEALPLLITAQHAVEFVGLSEARIPIARWDVQDLPSAQEDLGWLTIRNSCFLFSRACFQTAA